MGLLGNAVIGSRGSDDITDTLDHLSSAFDANGIWFVIEAYGGDAVFTTCTMTEGTSKDGITLQDGRFIWGLCNKISLTSGKVRAYRSVITP